MKHLRLAVLILLMLLPPGVASSQSYEQVPVKVSSDKVRRDGNLYYAHAVQERQTLFSIAKAYGVSVDAIIAANPDKSLKEDGPAKGDIILVPLEEETAASTASQPAQTGEEDGDNSTTSDGKYIIHVVKWYDDLASIAEKYGVSESDIMRANNLTDDKLKKRAKLRIPVGGSYEAYAGDADEGQQPQDIQEEVLVADTTEAIGGENQEEAQRDFLGFLRRDGKVRFSMLLPLTSQGKVNIPYMDFYSGALLALRDLGEDGISAEADILDISNEASISSGDLSGKDFIIGPVNVSGLKKALSVAERHTPVISPLDQEAAGLTDSCKTLAQVPSSHDAQYADLVKWLTKDFQPGDKVIVVSDNSGKYDDDMAMMDGLLDDSGIPYSNLTYNVLQGRGIISRLEELVSSGVNRVILVSESEAFANDVVRNLNLMVHRGRQVVFYGSSKVRSYKTIDVENLHSINTHLSVPYFIDYDSDKVRDFILAYRALYNTEPTQFAFQGYDVTSFFVKVCHDGGRNWFSDLSRSGRVHELQGDFFFARNGDGGLVNEGVRRIVYTSDFQITKVE